MLAIFFLIISFLFGWCIMSRMLSIDIQKNVVKIPLSLVIGTVFSVWITFLCNLFTPLSVAIPITLYILVISCFFIAPFKEKEKNIFLVSRSFFEYMLLLIFLLVTILLIHQSLHFTTDNFLQIGSNEWGDFELHLPLIRSFALGNNIPPSLPFFPNANAAYHFMFDYWSAIMEFCGLPLAYAFNITSIIAFTALLFCLYSFSTLLFSQKKIIGIFTVILFLFNSTLEFIEAIPKLHANSVWDFFVMVVKNNRYLSAGPFTSDHVSIIWSMNVYLNQRHLIFGFSIGFSILLLVLLILRKKINQNYFFLVAVLIGLIPFWDIYIFLCLLIITGILALFFVKSQPKILFIFPIALGLALPQTLWLSKNVHNFIQFNPGFLSAKPLTLSSFFLYWIYNLGASIITIPLGFYFATKEQKKWFIAIFCIFILGNLIQFNSEIFNNHKLFNFWIALSNCYSALFLYMLIKRNNIWKRTVFVVVFFLLIFSGIIDTFVVIHETFYTVNDYQQDTFMQWVANNTPQNAIFLVPNYNMYDSIRMAGRKTFVPFPRFATEYGYNTDQRNALIEKIYNPNTIIDALTLLHKNEIDYVEIPKNITENFPINTHLFLANLPTLYATDTVTILAVPIN